MALEEDASGVAVDVELGLEGGRQRNPVVLEGAGVVGEEVPDRIPATVHNVADGERAVIGPECHHGVDVAAVGSGSMEGGLQLVKFCDLSIVLAVWGTCRPGTGEEV